MASRTVEFSQNAPRAYPVLQKQSKTKPAPRLAEARGTSPRLLCPVSPRWAGALSGHRHPFLGVQERSAPLLRVLLGGGMCESRQPPLGRCVSDETVPEQGGVGSPSWQSALGCTLNAVPPSNPQGPRS